MKVRFLQITSNDLDLFALDDLGRIWRLSMRGTREWTRIENPTDEKKQADEYDFTQGFATRGDYPLGG